MPPDSFNDDYYVPIPEGDLKNFLLVNSCEMASDTKPVLAVIQKNALSEGKRDLNVDFYDVNGRLAFMVSDFAYMTADAIKIKNDGKVRRCGNKVGTSMPIKLQKELSMMLGYSVENA